MSHCSGCSQLLEIKSCETVSASTIDLLYTCARDDTWITIVFVFLNLKYCHVYSFTILYYLYFVIFNSSKKEDLKSLLKVWTPERLWSPQSYHIQTIRFVFLIFFFNTNFTTLKQLFLLALFSQILGNKTFYLVMFKATK